MYAVGEIRADYQSSFLKDQVIMNTSIDTKLSETDWDSKQCAWRCLMLRLSGVKIKKIYADDQQLLTKYYRIDRDRWVIHWNSKRQRPKEIRLIGSINLTNNDHSLTTVWDKTVIILSVITTVFLVLAIQFM